MWIIRNKNTDQWAILPRQSRYIHYLARKKFSSDLRYYADLERIDLAGYERMVDC